MSRRIILAVLAGVTALALTTPASADRFTECAPGAERSLSGGRYAFDIVEPADTHTYTITGATTLALESPGDIDVEVCVGDERACYSHGPAAAPELCRGLSPSTIYTVTLWHCVTLECGYEDVPLPLPYVLLVG